MLVRILRGHRTCVLSSRLTGLGRLSKWLVCCPPVAARERQGLFSPRPEAGTEELMLLSPVCEQKTCAPASTSSMRASLLSSVCPVSVLNRLAEAPPH